MITSFTPKTDYPKYMFNTGTATTFDRVSDMSSKKVTPELRNTVYDTIEAELDARSRLLNDSAMITITDLSGTIIYANDLFCRISGFERFRIIGYTHSIIRHSELSEETFANIWETISSGKTWTGEVKNRRKDGEILWSQATIAPVLDENGKPLRYIWVQHDISELKKTTNLLLNAKQTVDQQLLDNVNYTSAIQKALLPTEKELKQIFPSSHVLFAPKHMVSGDLYWFSRIADESILVLGDATGHGVSGAFVSVMALTGLKYAVGEQEITEPGQVLSQLNRFLYRAMNKHTDSGLLETIDMAFCRYNHQTQMLDYACGRSKIYLIRNNNVTLLCSVAGPVSSVASDEREIFSQSVQLQSGDRIYMMSDGLADQFGGEKDKRLGSKRVRELLSETSTMNLRKQQEAIRESLEIWRGTNEQTDDITMLAFEID